MDTQANYFKGTQELVTAYVAFIDQGAIGFWQSQGYIADETGVVGKTKGVDRLDAQKTTTWDIPREINGEWYVANAAKKFTFTQEYIDLFDANFSELVPVDELPVIDSEE